MSDTTPTTQVHVEEDGHKVFVGNLSFQTTEAELSELFSKPTPVLKANIITHGTRSRGYGFVSYDTLAQAEQAAATYNKAELGGREINVEVAKPKVERAPAAPKVKTPKQPKAETKEATETVDAADFKPRTGRNPRSRANRKTNRNKNEGEEGTAAEEPAVANDEAKEGARRKRNTRRSGRKGANGDAATEGGAAAPAAPSVPRTVGPPSKTTVFVANLPFSMEDAGLKELFAQFKVANAHVVRRRGTGRSKGFGFVELVDEAEQQNVIEKLTGVKADGRELVIKVALSEEQHSEKEGETKEVQDGWTA
ncbi:hypothetical protein BGZ96_009554 [Linnemannia gamsii]|uniref:RRM domain-containing protein n=1 Tax=Linnemannia gamsii TaxID=64522 RepID=A0ABQ7JY05_9FUNG|nr:hypothetical protein BGZ96_009554 [Linnemannia gamsii]